MDKLCLRGFTEKEWNDAYKRWKQLADYSSSSDMDLDYKPPEQTKTSRPLCDGELSLAAAMELDYSKPDDVPDYFQKILAKYSHANKKKRRSYSFKEKLAMISWIEHRYPNETNWSEASRLSGVHRKFLQEWVGDGAFIKKQVVDVKKSGSTKKHGGAAMKKRFQFKKAEYPEVEELLLQYFDERADKQLPISRKRMMKQSVKIAQELGFQNFTGS